MKQGEAEMDIGPVEPVWLTWLVAGGAAALAAATLARVLDAVFDLDRS